MKQKRNPFKLLLGGVAISLSTQVFAQQPGTDHAAHHAAPVQSSAALTEGEVRKIDKDARKITIRHGPIANLDMPAMTMVFQVGEPAMLEQVKTGDKIRFIADQIGGQYRVTHIELTK